MNYANIVTDNHSLRDNPIIRVKVSDYAKDDRSVLSFGSGNLETHTYVPAYGALEVVQKLRKALEVLEIELAEGVDHAAAFIELPKAHRVKEAGE